MVVKHLTFKSKSSFSKQLVSFFVISLSILTIIISLTTAWQTGQQIKKNTIETGKQVARNFAEQTVLALLTDSVENGQSAIERALGFQSVIGVAVYKSNRELLISSEEARDRIILSREIEPSVTVELTTEYDNYWLITAPVIYADDQYDIDVVEPDQETVNYQTLGYVVVEYDKSKLLAIQNSIFVNNISIGAIVAFILAFIMNLGIKRLTRPLSDLSQTMETAHDSKHYPKAQVSGALEISQIAKTYNRLMTNLEKQNSELESHRDTLESEVEIRTQELKIARDTALTASRHKSEFLANISHELRTPLQAIIGYSDLVKEDLELEGMQPQVDDLKKSLRAAHNLLSLINNILDLAKIEAGRMDLYLRPVELEALINDTLETIQPIATANNNTITVVKGKLSNSLQLDRQKVMQIFLNLLSNACKFTKDGEITFRLYNDKNFLYFSVKDTGVGIPEDQLSLIFEPFTQIDGSQTRKFEGTGLGMAITKNFCELMDGEMSINSTIGKGTTFSVKLPLTNDSAN